MYTDLPLLHLHAYSPFIKDLDTDAPLLTLGSCVLRGRYIQVIGSDLVFDTSSPTQNAGFAAYCTRRLEFEYI